MPKKISIPRKDGAKSSGSKRNPIVSVQKSKSGTQTNYKDGTGYWSENSKKNK